MKFVVLVVKTTPYTMNHIPQKLHLYNSTQKLIILLNYDACIEIQQFMS